MRRPGSGLVAFGTFAFDDESSATSVLIVPRTVGLLRETTSVLLEETPPGLDLEDVRRQLVSAWPTSPPTPTPTVEGEQP